MNVVEKEETEGEKGVEERDRKGERRGWAWDCAHNFHNEE